MSTREFFAQRLAAEAPAFLKVVRALPADRLDYRPHERNTSAGALAWQMALEIGAYPELFEKGVIDFRFSPPPDHASVVEATERNLQGAIDAAKAVSEEQWNAPAKFLWEGNAVWEVSVAEMAWGFLFDLVHHRGQLTAYIRPMGGKVPAVYGPSADEQS